MGNFDNHYELGNGMMDSLSGKLFIVANAAEIEPLRTSIFGVSLNPSAFISLPPETPLPETVILEARALVLEVDPASKASLNRISQVRALRPDLPIIAAIADATVSLVRALVRQGVADVAVLPFAPNELASQVLDAMASAPSSPGKVAQSPMITVVHSSGGSGATSTITHLAAALAAEGSISRGVCVIDLDLQNGDVAAYLGKSPKNTIASLLEAGERLDEEFLQSALADSGHGFSFIAAPPDITPLDTVNADQLMDMLKLARSQFGLVLIDVPADWTNWGLSVAAASHEIVLITDLSIASLRQAKRRIQLFASVGLGHDRIKVVINRVERRLFKTIGVDEVHDTLGCEVIATLSGENAALSAAQDEGLLITDVSHRSKFGNDVRALAGNLIARFR